MSAERPTLPRVLSPVESPVLPPVRLPSEAELARDALGAPLLTRAVRVARWVGDGMRVGAGGELDDGRLRDAARVLGLVPGLDGADADADADAGEGEGAAYASEAWRVAVDTGLVELTDPEPGREGEGGTARAGEELALVTGGSPVDVLNLWLGVLEAVLADAAVPDLDALVDALDEGGEIDFERLDWDPRREAEFLDGVLANLYLLTVGEGGAGPGAGGAGLEEGGAGPGVPLPVLAASMVVPEDMDEATDEVLERVSEVMMRLDDQFRMLEPVGLVEFRPVDAELLAEADDEPVDNLDAGDPEDVARYGMVRLTPLGLFGVRARMLEAGIAAPAVGDLAGKGADVLLDALPGFPEAAARAEVEHWLAGRETVGAAAELLAAARGGDAGGPLRRLGCQQALALVGPAAEPAVRAVLDDPELGGLARVWLAERGAADVPPPGEELVFWLALDTLAAQLAADGDAAELVELMSGLTGGHSGFFEAAWRVDHPAAADVLEAMGRLHPDRKAAKEARKAAFKARSRG
ncbi:hypothetical protein [Streptomyces sp. NPDC101132]|uniref:hypothetical protein n=1 Tax=Streptomyces sp. NPDC101132 TaxID=3366110 RepID=UPI0037F1535F